MREAVGFLTPLFGARRPTPAALRWFPAVGLALGLTLGGWWWVARQIWPAPVAAASVVIADLALTGLLHVDGLADCADGLLAHLPRERRLEVMSSPTVGAYAVAVLGATLLARFAALAVLRPAPLLLAALWCVSRTGMAGVVDRVRYARPHGGLASVFQGRRSPAALSVTALAASLVIAGLWSLPAGPVAVVAAAASFAGVVAFAARRLGGYTGDVLGAAGVVGETLGLLTAAARW